MVIRPIAGNWAGQLTKYLIVLIRIVNSHPMKIVTSSPVSVIAMPTVVVGMFLFVSALSSSAALVTWGSPQTIAGDSDVDTTGTLVGAWNIGDTGVASTTVNGVAFAPLTAPDLTLLPASAGALDINPTPGNFKSTVLGAGVPIAPFNTLSGSYQALLAAGTANPTSGSLFITVGGLSIGSPYLVQIWVNDSDSFLSSNPFNGTTIVTSGPTLDVNSTNSPGGVGQYVTGTFIADAVNQPITLNSGLGDVTVNGLQLRVIPEPAHAVLAVAGAALLALVWRRRQP